MHQEFESVSLAMSRAAVRAREEREAQRRADGAEGASGTAPANVQAPPTGIVRLRRQNEYRTAIESVGLAQVKNLERMMRDKLQQRTKSGPFQLRKNFRYFDVDADGEITVCLPFLVHTHRCFYLSSPPDQRTIYPPFILHE